ncbi:hypothetical protein J2W36_000020 [Variovorax ginsengisoli]|uniref:Uncharacterized protein n=1 Tax=Variovorax ginsengisoli TaxID=363844 RepID=A0ABT9S356_9BURK|nr:hypothetical protein [Variovorax ginsengisoli]
MRIHRPMTGQRCTDDACETRGNCRWSGLSWPTRVRVRPAWASAQGQQGWGRMDGGEPEAVLTCRGWRDRLRRGSARCRRFNAGGHWPQPGGPTQAHLNQQHQHKWTRFDPPVAVRLPAGYSVSVFRGRRLDWGTRFCHFALERGVCNGVPKRHRPHRAFDRALNFCLIKHLQERTGEKHYRCEAGVRGGGSSFSDSR